jgi:Xaa-Pro aminopeptidase
MQYLLGGYKFIFSAMDAIGPAAICRSSFMKKAARTTPAMSPTRWKPANTPTIPSGRRPSIRQLGSSTRRIAIEHLKKIGKHQCAHRHRTWLPCRSTRIRSSNSLEDATFVDATGMLERLRAIKTPQELAKLRQASELITDSMQACRGAPEGASKTEIVDMLRREETNRGLQFEYCLITIGSSHNRAISPQTWGKGETMSLDSGGNYHGYIGDLCRMGVRGEPDAELVDLLAEIEAVQQAAFALCKPGTLGGDMIAAAEKVLKGSKIASYTDFFAHGMGVITHEAPFLMTNHPVTYEGVDASEPLEPGLVLSVETTMTHPTRGFIKLEDTVAITATGHEMFGDRARGWTVAE